MSEMKRYSVSPEVGTSLLRIQALVHIPEYNVKKGDKGGLIEGEHNLPQDGSGWIDESSVVQDYSILESGLVCKNSELSGRVVMSEGKIEDSTLNGKISITGCDCLIKGCSLRVPGFYITYGKIENSILQNVDASDFFSIKKSKIQAGLNVWFSGRLVMEASDIYAHSGKLNQVTMQNSLIKTEKVFAFEKLTIENGFLSAEKELSFGTWNNSIDKKPGVTISGIEGEPVVIYGERISLISSTVSGSAVISGHIDITHSSISEMASINMKKGVLQHCTVTEMASIVQETDAEVVLEKLVLNGETFYEC
ncbi:hypothetical protein JMA_39200 (plasmid) [Jeotgalibacillus malaysiensis]|uniref:Uncharacterized protein n=1 Tax=Jeotgalibacillus malaysiensis TaxID=1508404 RepID=A0A0B5AXE3_9BACL|nr:hypothetical protein [Jeotgalibacillus malaysiensis]AJD93238.1 hypothetical protein JMA_39200 [Jeotgalibacillus malaysiensis]